MTELIPKPEGTDSTSNVLGKTYTALAEAIPGILASDKKQWALSIGYLFQRIRSGRFLETLGQEWNQYREKGRIKDDYIETEQHQACLQELLDFLDNDSPDVERFTALKNVFLKAATESMSSRKSALPQQLMKVCRSLNSGAVLVLSAAYELHRLRPQAEGSDLSSYQWLGDVAERSGLKFSELVEINEKTLVEKSLLTARRHSDGSGIHPQNWRLTDLALELCRFIEEE